jgi:hypothetical protein
MATKKETLEKLIDFVSELASQNNNAWFADKLVRKISDLDARPITRQMLNEMHEHCISGIIQDQAKGFYANFKIKNIKPALISYYCQMERYRRSDDFEEFCESLFEQIELISRSLFSDAEKNIVINNHKEVFLCGKTLWQLIFYDEFKHLKETFDSKPSKWGVEYQICAVLYTHYYKAPHPLQLNCEQFLYFKKLISQLLLIRNKNSHPGGTFAPTQESYFKELVVNKNRNYIKYLNFLEDITRTINDKL